MDNTIEKIEVKVGYTFNEKLHLHKLDGKPLTGVTTVLSVIAKPALIQWSANEAIKYVREHKISEDENTLTVAQATLDEAKTAHRKKKEEAGEKGTSVHDICEEIIKNAIEFGDGIIRTGKNPNSQVQNFLDWAIENKIKFLASERHLYSREHWIGGIVDFIGEIAGKRIVGDIKTSSAVYPEHFLQTSAYDLMLQEMGEPKSDKHIIVNVKKDGGFEVKENYDYEGNSKAFLAALTLYRQLESLK